MAGGGGSSSGVSSSRIGGAFTQKMKRRNAIASGLSLTSMLDILMALLFFLLQNFSQVKSDFSVGKDLTLPASTALQTPVPALQLVVTRQAILLDNRELVRFENGEIKKSDLLGDGVTIRELAIELKRQKERSQVQSAGDQNSWVGNIVMQADKDLPFSLLKKVIYTAGVSDFVMFKLAVLKKEV
jgi:biopolymer transport protein ExbD